MLVNSIRSLTLPSAVFALLVIGSCFQREPEFAIPERCYDVAGPPQLWVNNILQEEDHMSDFWMAMAVFDGTWLIDMTNEAYVVVFHHGVSPFTEEELNGFTNEDLARELEVQCTQSLQGGIADGRLWFFVKQPDGSELQLGDDPEEIIEGNVNVTVATVDGCDMIQVELYCLMGADPSHTYRIDVRFSYPYHFK
jgi:hypothetical protein